MQAAPHIGEEAASIQIVAALGLAGAWVFLLLTILDPVPSPLRYYLGSIFDAALLSAFLHVGAMLSAPWFPLYLLAAFYAGFRFGPAELTAASIANLIGFAIVVATTPFWQQQVLLAGGFVVAMIVLRRLAKIDPQMSIALTRYFNYQSTYPALPSFVARSARSRRHQR